ncbi:4-carboxy-4-hydroxy-2-oxoadipate aldolase/oxaloacetate decarboxylase [Lentzea sp. PSKA42]|uniref:Putative 4-hydroxy-4-methyl-2-oxoglutarate aldolase n=1 Tax=Lentzea indica TaxID=2604800 RepID=A0ABX1FWZ7_9PSEU|nr:4-carboxy-4-hydroxy-2-oxoadipate aldolase/oxaloacetate decarboxylase [Lentzea indica]NKE63435.1 4-carboxy-4-hydroxy-2-oxoadipate aldolase/oxaloacetate decarboxylase [Lentzea indica]
MRGVIITGPPKADLAEVDVLAGLGVATVHEAMGRKGSLGSRLRPIQQGAAIGGTAVTALCWPGDNLMIHAAVEQCGPGDVLVVSTTSPSRDGLFGELFATALRRRGVRGLVINAGVRDVKALRDMGFAVWSAAVSAQGTVKATAGSVNVPLVVEGEVIRPGDAVLADDDGVVCVPREQVSTTVSAARARTEKEAAARAAFEAGELGLDRYGLRETLSTLGVEYLTFEEYEKRSGT